MRARVWRARDAERVVTPLDDLRSSTPRNQPEFNKLFPASEGSGRHRATEPLEAAGDPLHDEAAVFIGRLLPCEVAGIQWVDLAVGQQVGEVLVVGPRHQVVLASGDDLSRRRDQWQQTAQLRVLLGVVADKAGGLGKAPEVIRADVVLMDVGL